VGVAKSIGDFSYCYGCPVARSVCPSGRDGSSKVYQTGCTGVNCEVGGSTPLFGHVP